MADPALAVVTGSAVAEAQAREKVEPGQICSTGSLTKVCRTEKHVPGPGPDPALAAGGGPGDARGTPLVGVEWELVCPRERVKPGSHLTVFRLP